MKRAQVAAEFFRCCHVNGSPGASVKLTVLVRDLRPGDYLLDSLRRVTSVAVSGGRMAVAFLGDSGMRTFASWSPHGHVEIERPEATA